MAASSVADPLSTPLVFSPAPGLKWPTKNWPAGRGTTRPEIGVENETEEAFP